MNRRSDGQAMVEIAIVLLLLMTVIFGGVAFVQHIGSQYAVSQAVRNAAHAAAVRGSIGGLPNNQWVALASAQGPVAASARDTFAGSPFVDIAQARIRASCETNPCRRYSTIRVEIEYQSEAWAPNPIGIGNQIRLFAEAQRTAEQDSQDG